MCCVYLCIRHTHHKKFEKIISSTELTHDKHSGLVHILFVRMFPILTLFSSSFLFFLSFFILLAGDSTHNVHCVPLLPLTPALFVYVVLPEKEISMCVNVCIFKHNAIAVKPYLSSNTLHTHSHSHTHAYTHTHTGRQFWWYITITYG